MDARIDAATDLYPQEPTIPISGARQRSEISSRAREGAIPRLAGYERSEALVWTGQDPSPGAGGGGQHAAEYVLDESQLAEAFAVRVAVFIEEQRAPALMEFDDADFAPTTTHAVVRDLESGEVVATGRVMLPADAQGEGRIGRVAVLPPARRRGVGSLLMAALERRALLSGDPVTLMLRVQVSAAAFYESLGYQLIGDVYDDAGMPHRDAIKFLSSPPFPPQRFAMRA